jgi:hypothetical protein
MVDAGSWEMGHLRKLDYASIMFNTQEPRDYGRLLTELSSVRELEILNFDYATFQVCARIYHHHCTKAFHRDIQHRCRKFCIYLSKSQARCDSSVCKVVGALLISM